LHDSPLEGDGFELPVPIESRFLSVNGNCHARDRGRFQRAAIACGTESSKSASESGLERRATIGANRRDQKAAFRRLSAERRAWWRADHPRLQVRILLPPPARLSHQRISPRPWVSAVVRKSSLKCSGARASSSTTDARKMHTHCRICLPRASSGGRLLEGAQPCQSFRSSTQRRHCADGRNCRRIRRGVGRGPVQRQTVTGAVERPDRCRNGS